MTTPSLAAFQLGYETRRLRMLQQTLWALCPAAAANVHPCVREIDRQLLALSNNLNEYQYSRFDHLRKRLIDRHEAAARTKGTILAEIIDQYEDPVDAFRRLQQLCPERCRFFVVMQEQDWQELRCLTRMAVQASPQLCARWEIGYGLAECLATGNTPPVQEHELLVSGMQKLSAKEQASVGGILAAPLSQETYDDLADFFLATVSGEEHTKPVWNNTARTLRVGGKLVARWRAQGEGALQLKVLTSFQTQGWPEAVENPFRISWDGAFDEESARNAVKELNTKTKGHIRFSASKLSISHTLINA